MKIWNMFKTIILLATLSSLLLMMGLMLGGLGGMIIALGLTIVITMSASWFSHKIGLRVRRTRKMNYNETSDLHRLAALPGSSHSRIYLVDRETLKAYEVPSGIMIEK